MAKTLLNGVNEVLKRVHAISGTDGEFTSLTDSARQPWIDICVQVWNETIERFYVVSEVPKPNELAEATLTLVTGTRAYSFEADFLQVRWPFVNQTNGDIIEECPGGYWQMFQDQTIPGNYTGKPQMGAIRETDTKLYLDRIPTLAENGAAYTYYYDKDVSLSAASDTMPFNDTVFRALVPAVAELWNRTQKRSFDETAYNRAIGTAARYANQTVDADQNGRGRMIHGYDPFEA